MKFRFKKSKQVLAISGLALMVISGGGYLYAAGDTLTAYSPTAVYSAAGTQVAYSEAATDGGFQVGVFKNGWYLGAGVLPKFYPNSSGWTQIGNAVRVTNLTDPNGTTIPAFDWNSKGTYGGGTLVRYNAACYKAKWWTTDAPTTSTWESVACPVGVTAPNPLVSLSAPAVDTSVVGAPSDSSNNAVDVKPIASATGAAPTAANPTWASSGVYLAGSVVQHGGVCYSAKWWTSGNTPTPSSQLKNEWDSPWGQLTGCPAGASLPANSTAGKVSEGGSTDPAQKAAGQPPSPKPTTEEAANDTKGSNSAAIPPVTPKPPSTNPSTPVSVAAPTKLPDTGYAFLRQVTDADWDWLFPLRSGKYHPNGGTRNSDPFANSDGSKDTFTLDAFKRAVLQYNTWAKQNNYKQFLNEGTVKQQAEEFLVFWAKSSRETSGSWSGAPAPWITKETFNGEAMDVWRGGLYWVEEVGYNTNSTTGKSAAISYVDSGSTDFPPSDGRSYYGRGPIQLSWNYNYGAFSYWMYDNGLFRTASDAAGLCKIDTRNKLLDFPNLVADCGDISIMSAIWFWQTPQGAKPSSHDVIFGDVTNISKNTQDRGLPQTNNGYVPKVASGDTSDAETFAFRVGAVINIVNGGLECNNAAKWHNGPLQRVSYYNAYAARFNEKYKLDVPRIPEATNVWDQKASNTSPVNLQSATCYNQKSYYGW